MAVLLRCVDRAGREVVLTEEVWFGKIVVDHVILRGHEALISVVLMDPYRITKDEGNDVRRFFYRHRTLPEAPNRFLKVVVDYRAVEPQGRPVGTVVSAYPTDVVKPEERRIWPRL